VDRFYLSPPGNVKNGARGWGLLPWRRARGRNSLLWREARRWGSLPWRLHTPTAAPFFRRRRTRLQRGSNSFAAPLRGVPEKSEPLRAKPPHGRFTPTPSPGRLKNAQGDQPFDLSSPRRGGESERRGRELSPRASLHGRKSPSPRPTQRVGHFTHPQGHFTL
jgi:hypothetical protein